MTISGYSLPSPRWVYVCLIAWIPAWLAIGRIELSYVSISFAVISLLPLFFPLGGVLKNQPAALIWGAYASLPAFLIGVMESWSNPQQRPGALVQLALVAVYWILVMAQAQHHRE